MNGSSVEISVRERYSAAAEAPEAALCCPIEYDSRYLELIPDEIIEKDYGCGDPSRYVEAGETVLDLGSGSGKICYIAAQVVGSEGRVIGVDMNDDMLALARSYQGEMAQKLGYANVEFRKGKIQDLALDRDRIDTWLGEHPIADEKALRRYEAFAAEQQRIAPLIEDGSVDVVVSNCVLNLAPDEDKAQLFREIHRVLRRGGRAVISDIVADELVPQNLKDDPELWSGCVSGALEETQFVQAFEAAGFYGIEILKRDPDPWRTVEGIEFRSVTVVAYKGKEGACWDHNEALIYKGPFSEVTDDDGHTFVRGQRVAVCRKTFEIYSAAPYAAYFEPVEPRVPVVEPTPFPCSGGSLERHPSQTKDGSLIRRPSETKGEQYAETTEANSCCEPGQC